MVQWLRRPFDHLQLETLVLSSIPNEGIFFSSFLFLCFSFFFFLLFFSFLIIFVNLESNERNSSFALLSFYQKLFFLQFIIVTHHSAKTHVEDKRDGNNPRKHYHNSI